MSGSGISWAIRKSAPRSRQNLRTTPPLIFLQAGCPSCCPTNSVKALKAQHWRVISYNNKHKYDEMKVIRRGSIAPCTNHTNVCRQKQFHLNGVNIKRIHAALKLPAESVCLFVLQHMPSCDRLKKCWTRTKENCFSANYLIHHALKPEWPAKYLSANGRSPC